MKDEKGLTFLSTILIVIIIALIVFGVVYIVKIQMNKENLENLKTDMLLVQAKTKKIQGDYTLDKKDETLVGTKISEMQENETIKSFIEKDLFKIDEKNKKYYVLNQDNLNSLELNQVVLEEGHFFIVEYTENEIYHTKGFTYTDGNTYYKLSEIENLEMQDEF